MPCDLFPRRSLDNLDHPLELLECELDFLKRYGTDCNLFRVLYGPRRTWQDER